MRPSGSERSGAGLKGGDLEFFTAPKTRHIKEGLCTLALNLLKPAGTRRDALKNVATLK